MKKNPEEVKASIAFAFPDLYEIGMSYMGLQILYHILNREEDIACERVFAPAPDMESLMRDGGVPLYTCLLYTSRENVKKWLEENTDVLTQIQAKLLETLKPAETAPEDDILVDEDGVVIES